MIVSEGMTSLYRTFERNGYEKEKETSKATEFKNIQTGEVIYLLPTQEIGVVLDPKTVENHIDFKSEKKYHSTALKKFPKRVNKGQTPIHYGYSFKFKSIGELESFIKRFNEI